MRSSVSNKPEEKNPEKNRASLSDGNQDGNKIGAIAREEEEPAKNKTRFLHFWIFAAALILFFIALIYVPNYLHHQEVESNRYNGFDFYKGEDGYWYTVIQKGNQPYQLPFYYHPRELEDIPVELGISNKFFEMIANNGSIFITLDPDFESKAVIAGVEIAKITGQGYHILNVPTRSAFIRPPTNLTVNSETPIISCLDSNNRTLVIGFVLTGKNLVYSQDYCIRLEAASYDDMIRVADRLMYNLLGIMRD